MSDPQQAELIITADGSPTFFRPDLNEYYHSVKGALTESLHVFIGHGFQFSDRHELRVLEVGFGTGLNTALTAEEALNSKRKVFYHSLEPFPLDAGHIENYINALPAEFPKDLLRKVNQAPWQNPTEINPFFTLFKDKVTLQALEAAPSTYDLVYFDAFAPSKQEELWTLQIMQKIYDLLGNGGILVSYCAQGQFRRNLKAAGFKVKKLPGPPRGKWQMTRALKV